MDRSRDRRKRAKPQNENKLTYIYFSQIRKLFQLLLEFCFINR